MRFLRFTDIVCFALLGIVLVLPARAVWAQSCDDLAIGVSGDRAGGEAAGAANVLIGSQSLNGLTPIGNQIWYQGANPLIGDSDAGDFFGFSVAAGDFNGDLAADLAIGMPGKTVADAAQAGAVNVVYGTFFGLGSMGQFWSQATPGFTCCTADEADLFGHALAAGDFDSDGYDDLVIGVWAEDAGPFSAVDSGQIHIVHGSPSGLLAVGNEVWQQEAGGVAENPDRDDRFGFSLAVGDFDGNGTDDLAIGAPGETKVIPPATFYGEAGAVHALYSNADGLTSSGQGFWFQDDLLGAGASRALDFFGWALAAGDFDRDGYDDLAIGVPFDNDPANDAGSVHVLYGTPAGLSTAGHQHWTQADLGDDTEADQFGKALVTGDFNRDGYDDLVVGAPEETLEGTGVEYVGGGAAHILYGSASGLVAQGSWMFSRLDGLVAGDAEAGGEFGSALAAGDFDCDGYDDIAVGAPGQTLVAAGAGTVNVIHGSYFGLLPAVGNQQWSQGSLGVLGSAQAGDHFGTALVVLPELWHIFSDGFESENMFRWSDIVP